MPVSLKTQAERTAKTPIPACRARVGGLCHFCRPAERVPAGSPKTGRCTAVRELADRADINRGTFYIHYKDVGDLLQQLEDEMAERLITVCCKHAHSSGEDSAFPYLADLYHFAKDNADLCLVLLGPNGDRAYTERICGILRDHFLRDFVARFYAGDPERLSYFCHFIVSGNLSLTLEWLQGGAKETPEEMAALAGTIIMGGVRVL